MKALNLRAVWDQHRATLVMLAIVALYMSLSVASTTGGGSNTNDAAFANGYDWLQSVIHGKLGVLLAAVAFIIGLIWGIVKQAPMAVVGGVIFALLIAFGVDMATGIVNSSLIM